jgi:hypothetical protein
LEVNLITGSQRKTNKYINKIKLKENSYYWEAVMVGELATCLKKTWALNFTFLVYQTKGFSCKG